MFLVCAICNTDCTDDLLKKNHILKCNVWMSRELTTLYTETIVLVDCFVPEKV